MTDKIYYNICKELAKSSRCFSRKIGAIIVKDDSIVASGYNGPPDSLPSCDERWYYDTPLWKKHKENNSEIINLHGKCPRQVLGFESGRGLKWCVAVHAEAKCIFNAVLNNVDISNSSLYLNTNIPCKDCLIAIISSGIKYIICEELEYYDTTSKYIIERSKLKIRIFSL